jgi:hypothetical protein
MHGSGKTEWFWFVFPVTPIVLLIAVFIIQILVLVGIVAGVLWVGYHAYK